MKTKLFVGGLSLGALVLATVGAVPVPPAPPVAPVLAPAPLQQPNKPATSDDLGGATRYLSFLTTDKPMYRPGDKLYARDIILNAATHQPLGSNENANAQIQVLGPRGETLATGMVVSQDSVAGFDWTIPDSALGGEYTLKIDYPWQGYAPVQRKFDVRVYRAPRLKSQITFARDGYGASDKVTATLHTERSEGGVPINAKVTVTALVDDVQVYAGPASVDVNGNCIANFDLPKAMSRGDGTLAFAIEDGGTVETAAKTIPILLQTVDLNIYPEGGDPVAGVDNRYYIEAKTPAKKPADLVGMILDSHGKKVADVKTEHEGRGRFDFTPAKGETYTLKLTEPAGISKTWNLPQAKDNGVALQSLADIALKNQSVKFKLSAAGAGAYKVTLTRHEVQAADPITLNLKSLASGVVEFKPKTDIDGVLTATVWNDKGEPLAERLVYRQPAHQINVQISPSQSTYAPGDKASVNITTTDETGKAVSAVVGLTVTDDSILEMVEKREQAPRLPVMVFLEPEVKELADAQVYLDPANPKAPLATDLLLGTQGWRRFALIHTDDFLSKNGDDAKRVLAQLKPSPPALAFGAAGGLGGGGGGLRGGRGGGAGGGIAPMAMRAAAEAPQGAAVNAVGELKEKAEFNLANAPVLDRKLAPAPAPMAAAMPMLPANAAANQVAMNRVAIGGGGGAGGGGRRGIPRAAPSPFLVIREYAHDLRPDWSPTDRSDFTETLYWNAGIKTDDAGHASASFALSDSVSSYRISADSFNKDGSIGAATKTFDSVQPFYVEAKMPLEVTTGDVIQLPVTAVNNMPENLQNFTLTVNSDQSLKIEGPSALNQLAAGQRVRQVYKITVGNTPGSFDLTVNASAGKYQDKVTRKLVVKPKGFPTDIAYGGLLDKDNAAKKQFIIPASMVPSSMATMVTVYPSPVANLTEAVAALMREPNGCFEQTSSSNYPLAMAQLYFKNHQGVDPKLIAEADVLLGHGYQRLISFECQDKGYEWFGGNAPGHEALTAYGLMEFNDMSQANPAMVDNAMVERTRTWLISREDGKGGFQRNAKSLDSFGGAPELTTNAYIVWALMQAGQKNLEPEIAAVRDAAKTSDDSYVVALAANICNMVNDADNAHLFMDKLAKKQTTEGGIDGAVSSITRSGGQALTIEATSLASIAWNADNKYAGNNQSAIKFIADSCKGGRFGSTQSTILALKAITAYDTAQAHPKAPGEVTLMVDNQPLGDPIQFTADTKEPLKFPDLKDKLKPGPHTIALQMNAGSQMPFSMDFGYNSTTPATDKECTLDLQSWLKDAQITEGNITEARVQLTNTSDKDAPSPMAIIGIPGGLEVRHDQLKELVKSGKIDAYEVNGREVILYWRQLKAMSRADFSISLTAAVPGTYTAPASRTYLYYTDEYKQWTQGSTVTITPK